MDNLQPGRNYSIAVRAISNGIDSTPMTVFQATSKLHKLGIFLLDTLNLDIHWGTLLIVFLSIIFLDICNFSVI